MKHDILLGKNEHLSGAEAYPVDLSLFLEASQGHPTPRDISSISLQREDPGAVAQYALLIWNNFWASRDEQTRADFLRATMWLVEHAQRIGGDAEGWPLAYSHSIYFTRGSWLSSSVQGCGLSALIRAYQLTGDECFLETAHLVARTFERDILDGGVSTPIGTVDIFFEEVAVYPAAHTLHGCIFALIGLHDYAAIPENSHMAQLFQRGEATLHNLFDEFDLGYWTRVDLLRRGLSAPAQLAQQVALLEALAGCSGCFHCAERAARWQRYQCGSFPRLLYALTRREALLKQALLRRVRAVIISRSPEPDPRSAQRLRVCVPVAAHPAPGGIGTFLDRTARIMADRWQIEYLTQHIGPDVGERVIHQFGRNWMMTPWYFPQVWLYILAGARKLLSLMRHGSNYGLIMPQDGVFSGAFATLIGKLTGVRVVCIDHSTLTWYKNRAYRIDRLRELDGRAWPWLFRLLVRLLLAFYWPSLHMLARLATAQADHFLIPGVPGDEIDEICRELLIPASRVTRFNLTVDMQRYEALSAGERETRRASMDIPIDAIVIAIAARLDPEKGLDISTESISRAVSSLSPSLRDRVRVMIAGDGKLRGWLEEDIRKRGLGHICRMMGYVSNKEIQSLLVASDILLYTSTRGACMPLAVLEGMAAGCAVIASNEPLANVHLLAGERGLVVPAGDVEQTSRALEHLLTDSTLRASMGKAAREYMTFHHSTEAFRRVLLQVSYWSELDELLERRVRPLQTNEKTKRGQGKTVLHTSECVMSTTAKPISPLEGIEHSIDMDSDFAAAGRTDEVPLLEPSTVDGNQLPMQVELEAIPPMSSSGSPVPTSGISTFEQPTRLLPLTPTSRTVSSRAPPLAAQTSDSESYLALIRNLIKNSGIYAISSLTSPFVTLLLSPFLAHVLSRTDFGALAVLNTFVLLATGITELGLGAAFTRLYSYDCKTQREQLDALSTLLLLLLLILVPITATGIIAAPWLSELILGKSSYSGVVRVSAVLVLSQNLTVPGLMWLRVESRATLFSTISIANLLITAGASVVLVGILHMGIAGSLVANGLGDVIIIVCTVPIIFWHAGFHLRFALAGSMLAFGIPHVINLISGWVLQLSDRFLLEHFASLSLAAGYSVAYSLGGALSAAIIAPFSLAWWVLMYPIAKCEDAQHVFKLIFRGFSFVLLFATLGLSLFGSSILDLLFPPSYHAQSSIIPIIALSIMFNGIFVVVSLAISLKRKTWLNSLYYIFSALVNLGLNVVLIPIYGAMGAAVATLVAYIALVLIAYLINQRIYYVPFEIGLFLVALGVGILLYLVDNSLVQEQSIAMTLGIHFGALLLFGLGLLFLGWFPLVARIMHSFIKRRT